MSAVVLGRFVQREHVSALFLAELEGAHAVLLDAMAALDEVTGGPLPDRPTIIDARWNIGRASLARRTLWTRIHPHLADRACARLCADLDTLQRADRALLRSSSEHVSRWTINHVLEDWSSYCEASRRMRWKMKAAIRAEKRVLYPALAAVEVQPQLRPMQ